MSNTFKHPVIGQKAVVQVHAGRFEMGVVVGYVDDSPHHGIAVSFADGPPRTHGARMYDPKNVRLVKIEYEDGLP